MEPNNNDAQSIEKLRERYDDLKTKRITAEANLQTSTEALEDLKQEARQKYGTDDLDALRAMLKAMKEENEKKRAAYQEHLKTIETKLDEIEAEHAEMAEKESEQ